MNFAKRSPEGGGLVPEQKQAAAQANGQSSAYAHAKSGRRFVSHLGRWNLIHQQSRADFCEDRFQMSHQVIARVIPERISRRRRSPGLQRSN